MLSTKALNFFASNEEKQSTVSVSELGKITALDYNFQHSLASISYAGRRANSTKT